MSWGFHTGSPLNQRKALLEHPDAKGLLVINPTYFGIAADLKASSSLLILFMSRC